MKKLLTYFIATVTSLSALGQCYHIQERPYFPDPFNGGTIVVLNDDIHSSIVDIGFPFCFFGDTVSKCVISSNGYISFDTTLANTLSPWGINTAIPSNMNPLFSIMGPWQDLNPQVGGGIEYATYGVPPYRRFVVSYSDVAMFSCTTIDFSNQIVIYESLNIIDINIRDKQLCETWNDGNAIQGIQNQTGLEAYTVQGRNFPNVWTAQYDSYRFIPTCDCPTDSLPGFGIVPGKVFWDENGDCELSPGELPLANVQIDIQPGNGVVWTNGNGEFGIVLEPGEYTFEHSTNNPWYIVNECQPNGIPVTVVEDSNAVDICFADSVVEVVDISATIVSNAINACFFNQQTITICNESTVPVQNVEVEVQIPSFTGTSNSSFTATSDSTYSLTIPLMSANECRTFSFFGTANCDSSMIGQVACLQVNVNIPENDIDSTNNQMSFCDSVGVSYDPNDIRVMSQFQPEGWRTQEFISDDDELMYMIRFQNTGTGPAYNVIIKNELSNYLEGHSVEFVAASHDYYAQMIDGELQFNFLGIELPDSASDPIGSQGYVIYKINQTAGNQMGTVIPNSAGIYFDFNAPVITNSTENKIAIITNIDEDYSESIRIYPNPTTGEVNISNLNSNNQIHSIQLLDIRGRELKLLKQNQSTFDMNEFTGGVYLLRVETEKGLVTKRIIKN